MRAILVDEPIALHQGIQTQQRRQVVTEYLGGQILLVRQPTQSRDRLQIQSMLDALECFLDTPALVILETAVAPPRKVFFSTLTGGC
jgi:hypothetical protein